MTVEVLAAASPGEVRVAVAEGEALLDFCLWRPGAPDGVGDVYRARLTARMPALAGSFVALGGLADGFLPDSEGGKGLTEGSVFLARITRAAQGGKGPRLRVQGGVDAGGPPGLVSRGPHGVLRMAEAWPEAPVATDDAALAALLRPALGERLHLRHGTLFPEPLAARIDELARPELELAGGLRMTITPTRALVAIDLDLGGASAARETKQRHQMHANRAMLPELARQIRLRNLSGAILVDFAGLPIRARAALGPALAEALAADPLRPRLLGFTALGLAEIVRPRIHPPLHELLAGPHAAGLAALRCLAAEIAVRPAMAPVLCAAPAVASALRADHVAVDDLARRAGRALVLRDDHGLAPLGWRIEETTHG